MTSIKSVLVAAALVAGGLCASAAPKDVPLAEKGKAEVTIYTSVPMEAPDKVKENPGRIRLRASIRDLALYLGKMSGATIETVVGAPPTKSKTVPVLIGDLGESAFGPPAIQSPFRQAFRVVVSKKAIACIGESDEAISYAIYEILDRLGCRWYMPGDFGEVIPRLSTVRLPAMDISEVPATVCRNIWYADEAYKRRNRLGGIYYLASHGLEGWITEQERKDHLDWNAEINGKRAPEHGRICWGNPEVAQAVAANIIRSLDKAYYPCITISPGDGMTFCQCEKCKALDTGDYDPSMACMSITDRFIHFCNQIADGVGKKYPNTIFGMLAYVQYTRPPIREKAHPNIIPQLAPITYCRAHSMANPNCPSCQSLRPIVEGWGKAARMVAMYQYAYNLAEVSCPFPMITKWSEDLPILFKSNVKLWTPETMPNFESTLPGLYLGVRMSWYTQADPREILKEFFTRFYGAAAEPMERYWRTIDAAWATVPEHAGCRFGHLARFTPEAMKGARQAMNDALAACQTALEYRRVRIAHESFREFELYMKIHRNLADGQWGQLQSDTDRWQFVWEYMRGEYAPQSAFSPYGASYFNTFSSPLVKDATRLATTCKVTTRPLRQWRYMADKDGQGEKQGWNKPEFDDKGWKVTDPCVATWSSLGLFDYFSSVWYRAKVVVPAVPAGKKVFLWIGGTDGNTKLFVNGQHVPFINAKGEAVPEHGGYCDPVSFDITKVVKPGAENHFALFCTRWASYINELGTGGLMGPLVVYHE